jgi:hypothetical protein
MASPSITYPSPTDGHTPVGSPAPSQILLHRVSSPNHLAQHQYVESPRSVPSSDHVFHYSTPSEHFEYDHSQELYIHNEQMYEYNGNGSLQVEQQFVQQHLSPSGETTNLMFMVDLSRSYLTVAFCTNSTSYSYAPRICEPVPRP